MYANIKQIEVLSNHINVIMQANFKKIAFLSTFDQ